MSTMSTKLEEWHTWLKKYYTEGGFPEYYFDFICSEDIRSAVDKLKDKFGNEIYLAKADTDGDIGHLEKYKNR